MPEILNLLAPLILGSISRENLPKWVRKKGATLTVAGKKLFQKDGAVSLL
jgi:predicted Na+-dependent transporter